MWNDTKKYQVGLKVLKKNIADISSRLYTQKNVSVVKFQNILYLT